MDETTELLILQKLTSIDGRLKNIETRTRALPAFVTRSDIARELGCHPSLLSKKKWLLPNYGETDTPGREGRWDIEVWEQWKLIPIETRRSAWEAKQGRGNGIRRRVG